MGDSIEELLIAVKQLEIRADGQDLMDSGLSRELSRLGRRISAQDAGAENLTKLQNQVSDLKRLVYELSDHLDSLNVKVNG